MTYKEYREDPGINQSFLKQVMDNKLTPITATKRMIEGSIIDCMLYTPEEFNTRYAIIENLPSGKLKEVLDFRFLKGKSFNIAEIVETLRDEEYRSNWGNTSLEKEVDKYELYYNVIEDGLYPMTQKEYSKFSYAKENILSSHIWEQVHHGNNEFQKALFAWINIEDESIKIKGLLDDLHIDENKGVATITDCKCTKASNWLELALSLRYDFQMAYYKELVEQNYPELKVVCQWLVYDMNRKVTSLYKTRDFDLVVGKYGVVKEGTSYFIGHQAGVNAEFSTNKTYISGFMDVLTVYKQCIDLGLNDFDIEAYRNKNIYNKSLYLN